MSDNYSRIYVKYGKVEITIEGNGEFASEAFREIFNLQNEENPSVDTQELSADKQELSADKQEPSVQEQYAKPPKPQKSSPPSVEKKEDKSQKVKSTKSAESKDILNALGTDFKNWLNSLPQTSETRDKILAAACYNQLTSSDQKFYTQRVRNILENQGIEIPHIANFLDTMEIQKLIYKVSDTRRKGYKLTQEGEKYVKNLF
ncbi:MAG: hypothetical protein ACLFM7_10280 [Bacteroidales bacterium]